MSTKWSTLFLVGTALIGLFLSLWIARMLPLWLDERYSFYFAGLYSPWQLLYHSPDTHPGLYYLFTKVAVTSVQDLWSLRVLLGVLPQWIGSCLVVAWMVRKRVSQKSVALAAVFLFLNPFVIYTTSQMRMYGLVALFSSLIFICFQWWREKPSFSRYMSLFAILLIGNAVSYSLFFVSFGVLAVCVWQYLQTRKVFYQTLTLFFTLPFEFLFLAGSSVKKTFEWGSSWIPMPSILNTPSLFWTVLGVERNLFLQSVSLSIGTISFYLLMLVGLLVLKQRLSLRYLQKNGEVLFLIGLPLLLIISVSFVFPLLSQRFFFYTFLPKLSLFLPRVFLPFVILAESYVGLKKKLPWQMVVGSGLLVCLWVFTYGKYASEFPLQRAENLQQQQVLSAVESLQRSSQKNLLSLPSWFWLGMMSPDHMGSAQKVEALVQHSEQLEGQLLNHKLQCADLKGNTIIYAKYGISDSTSFYYEDAQRQLDQCCTTQQADSLHIWSCE